MVATRIDLSPFGAALERALASLGPSERRGRVALPIAGGGSLAWEFARAPLTVSVVPPRGEGDARVRVVERLALALLFDGGSTSSCATDGAALVVTAAGTPVLSSENGLAIAVSGAEVGIEVEGSARCTFGAVTANIAFGPLLRPLLSPIAAVAQTALASVRVKIPGVERFGLNHLGTHLAIRRTDGSPACLTLHDGDLVLGPISANLDGDAALDVALGLEVAPVLSLRHCPPPPSGHYPRTPALRVARGPLADRFAVTITVEIPLSTVEAQLRSTLTGTRLGAGRRTITLGAPSLLAARGRLIVFVPVDGALHGTLVLWGTPTVDGAALTLPDLRLALQSRSALERSHFARLAADDSAEGPTARARAALRRDLTPLVDEFRTTLSMPRALGDARIVPAIESLRPTSVRALRDVLYLTLVADGRAQLILNQAP